MSLIFPFLFIVFLRLVAPNVRQNGVSSWNFLVILELLQLSSRGILQPHSYIKDVVGRWLHWYTSEDEGVLTSRQDLNAWQIGILWNERAGKRGKSAWLWMWRGDWSRDEIRANGKNTLEGNKGNRGGARHQMVWIFHDVSIQATERR